MTVMSSMSCRDDRHDFEPMEVPVRTLSDLDILLERFLIQDFSSPSIPMVSWISSSSAAMVLSHKVLWPVDELHVGPVPIVDAVILELSLTSTG